jgi:hypothetical protein
VKVRTVVELCTSLEVARRMSEQDLESFLENYKRIIEMKSDMCEGLKASRIAEMYVAHGKPGDSLEYFERALVMTKIL